MRFKILFQRASIDIPTSQVFIEELDLVKYNNQFKIKYVSSICLRKDAAHTNFIIWKEVWNGSSLMKDTSRNGAFQTANMIVGTALENLCVSVTGRQTVSAAHKKNCIWIRLCTLSPHCNLSYVLIQEVKHILYTPEMTTFY